MGQHATVLGYFFQAGFVVKSVMLILLAASILSWTLIFQRYWFFYQRRKQYQAFQKRFWDCDDLSKLYLSLDNQPQEKQGLVAIFYSGFKEFVRLSKLGNIALGPIQRAMQISHDKESLKLERNLSLFASIGSISPYIGLFGTVWGIMTAFQALGQAHQATIAMVAPGISEALVATALGLFTAIPAVLAYNRYTTTANSLLDQYDVFAQELIALIAQQASYSKKEETDEQAIV